MSDGQDQDLQLVSLWIAFNSLYAQWDACKREPKPDRESWRVFVDHILKLDCDGHVPAMLQEHKRLVMHLCSKINTSATSSVAGPVDQASRAGKEDGL